MKNISIEPIIYAQKLIEKMAVQLKTHSNNKPTNPLTSILHKATTPRGIWYDFYGARWLLHILIIISAPCAKNVSEGSTEAEPFDFYPL
jgi:hypothetical protein